MNITVLKKVSSRVDQALFDLQVRNERIMQVALQRWHAFALKQIQRDLTTRFIKDLTTELTDWEFIEEQGKEMLRPATLKVMQSSGNKAYELFQVKGAFDVLNPEAVKAADRVVGHLVRGVTQETREGVRAYIKAGIKEGKSMDKVARGLRPLVGLTENQVNSVTGYEEMLREKRPELSSVERDKKVNKYGEKTHRRRMQTIARTETARAQNVGYAVGMEDLGVAELQFLIYPDEKTCAACSSLNKERFSTGRAGDVIPVHPNCRCVMLPVIGDKTIHNLEEARKGIPDHVDGLLKKLERTTDPTEGRKIRRALRKLGHTGGLGGKPGVAAPPTVKPTVPTIPKPKLKPQEKWVKSVTKDERGSIWWYQSDFKNVKLHRKFEEEKRLIKHPKAYKPWSPPKDLDLWKASHFARVTNRAPNWRGQVFRGLRLKKEELSKYAVGKSVELKHLTSSTTNVRVARSYAATYRDLKTLKLVEYKGPKVVLEMATKTGVDLRDLFEGPMKEVLLKPGKFKVVSQRRVGKYIYIRLEEVTKIKPR